MREGSEGVFHHDSREVKGFQPVPYFSHCFYNKDFVTGWHPGNLDCLHPVWHMLCQEDNSSVELVPADSPPPGALALAAPPGQGVKWHITCHVREPNEDSHEQVELHLSLVLLPCFGEELTPAGLLRVGLDDAADGLIAQVLSPAKDLAHVSYGAFKLRVVAGETFNPSGLQDGTSLATKEGHEEVTTCLPEALLSCFPPRESSGNGLVLLPKENRAALIFPQCLGGIAPPVGGSERDRTKVEGERGGHEARGGFKKVQGWTRDNNVFPRRSRGKGHTGLSLVRGWEAVPRNRELLLRPDSHETELEGGGPCSPLEVSPLRENEVARYAADRSAFGQEAVVELEHARSLDL